MAAADQGRAAAERIMATVPVERIPEAFAALKEHLINLLVDKDEDGESIEISKAIQRIERTK